MNLQDYYDFCRRAIEQKVCLFVLDKYGDKEYIPCCFYIYRVNRHKGCIDNPFEEENIELKRADYITLLSVLAEKPNLTFQELPLYIPIYLYKQLLNDLNFDMSSKLTHASFPAKRSSPVGIDMDTLQCDLKEIIGDRSEIKTFVLQSGKDLTDFHEVRVSTWMNLMQVSINYKKDEHYIFSRYGTIDLNVVKKLLKIDTCDELHKALMNVRNAESKGESDAHWLVRWLDRNGIKYIYTE